MLRGVFSTLLSCLAIALSVRLALAQDAAAASACGPPPQASAAVLGNVSKLLSTGKKIDGSAFNEHPAKQICKLPGGEIYFEVTTLNIDDDGSKAGSPENWEAHPVRKGKIDASHQDQTSYGGTLPAVAGKGDPISAFTVPYIVLPGVHSSWYRQQGLKIGDGAVVIKGNQRIVAVFADVGPDANIGEMSAKGHELFGFETFGPGLRARRDADGKPMRDPATGKLLTEPATVTVNHAQTGPFIVIVFPQSSAGKKFVSVEESLQPKIDPAFARLAGTGSQ